MIIIYLTEKILINLKKIVITAFFSTESARFKTNFFTIFH
jgi:hypothetical protein